MPDGNETTKDLSELACVVYDVAIDGTDVGYVNDPEFALEMVLKERKLTQLMDQAMGHRIRGVKASGKINLCQITAANIALAFPWHTGEGAISMMPIRLGGDTYQYAKPITFHPRFMGADTSQDYCFLKAVFTGSHKREGKGADDDVIPLEFTAYPDRDYLPDMVLGVIGDPDELVMES
jgi:hypothetical protein